ncbi:MAG: DinB family protein [Bacteroidia bacterium]|nr:DinB family protein [Bacteroidia bacterium]
MQELPYYSIPDEPQHINSASTIARFVDGLGFRYRWATEGLTENEIQFRPVESSMNMLEVVHHIYNIVHWVNRSFGGDTKYDKSLSSFEELRKTTLELLEELSQRLKQTPDSTIGTIRIPRRGTEPSPSFWFALNGPIADALTHVGQITSWRRMAGNPQPKGVDVFNGKKHDMDNV